MRVEVMVTIGEPQDPRSFEFTSISMLFIS